MSDDEENDTPYYTTYTLQQFMNRIKMTEDQENWYTSNFAMKDEVKVDAKLLVNEINNCSDSRGHLEIEFENEIYNFEYIKNDELRYISCLRTSGGKEETSKMLDEIDEEHRKMLESVDNRQEYKWMSHWSQILSPYASTVKVVQQKTEKVDKNGNEIEQQQQQQEEQQQEEKDEEINDNYNTNNEQQQEEEEEQQQEEVEEVEQTEEQELSENENENENNENLNEETEYFDDDEV